jgi:hypothetical protein
VIIAQMFYCVQGVSRGIFHRNGAKSAKFLGGNLGRRRECMGAQDYFTTKNTKGLEHEEHERDWNTNCAKGFGTRIARNNAKDTNAVIGACQDVQRQLGVGFFYLRK